MAVKNTVAPQQQQENKQPKFQAVIKSPNFQKNILETLGDVTRTKKFTGALITTVSMNPELQKCDYVSIISAALLGETLNLSPSSQLGYYYMIPYKQKAKDGQPEKLVATFQLGYKAYIQLAIRSGQYKRINVVEIKEGELISWNPLTEEIQYELIEDDELRETLPTVGYYAYFELLNGFKKSMYWSKKKMLVHADKYSQAFSKDGGNFGYQGRYHRVSYNDYVAGNYNKADEWMYSSYWYKDFDGMAFKTMLRQLISKWGIMSVEMQTAYTNDYTFKDSMDENAVPQYTEGDIIEAETVGYEDDPVEVQPTETIDDIPWDDMPYDNSLI